MGAPFKMKGFSGFGNSPLKHYTGVHKGAKDHPAHKLEDLSPSNLIKRTKKNLGKLHDQITGKSTKTSTKKVKAAKVATGLVRAGSKGLKQSSKIRAAGKARSDMAVMMEAGKRAMKPKKGKFLKTKVEKKLKMNKKVEPIERKLKSTQDKLNENIQKGIETKYSN